MAAIVVVGGRSGRGSLVVPKSVLVVVKVVTSIVLCRAKRLPHGACVSCGGSCSHPLGVSGCIPFVILLRITIRTMKPARIQNLPRGRRTKTSSLKRIAVLLTGHEAPLGVGRVPVLTMLRLVRCSSCVGDATTCLPDVALAEPGCIVAH